MKRIVFLGVMFVLFYACSSNSTQETNANQEEQQIINTMQQSLDSSNAEIVMERDTSR